MRSLRNFYVFRCFEVYWMSWSDKFLQVFMLFQKLSGNKTLRLPDPVNQKYFRLISEKVPKAYKKSLKRLKNPKACPTFLKLPLKTTNASYWKTKLNFKRKTFISSHLDVSRLSQEEKWKHFHDQSPWTSTVGRCVNDAFSFGWFRLSWVWNLYLLLFRMTALFARW